MLAPSLEQDNLLCCERQVALPHHAHLLPVVGELTAAVEANHIMAGSRSDRFPIVGPRCRSCYRCGKWLGGPVMAAGERKDLEQFFYHGGVPKNSFEFLVSSFEFSPAFKLETRNLKPSHS